MKNNGNFINMSAVVLTGIALVAYANAAEDCDQKATNEKTTNDCNDSDGTCFRTVAEENIYCTTGSVVCKKTESTYDVEAIEYDQCWDGKCTASGETVVKEDIAKTYNDDSNCAS